MLRPTVVFLAATLTALSPSRGTTQDDGAPVVLGAYRTLHSEILAEDRALQVSLPRGYGESNLSYPVIYLFYSDWVEGYFSQAVNDLYHLGMDRMPRAILVGVPNTQRYRDLLPWARSPGDTVEGHADRFLRFLEEEMIPFVESEYRTKPFRIMVGPQAAAVFGAYALLESPETFQAFILNDPCSIDSEERSVCREILEFAASPTSQGVYFAVSHDARDNRRDNRRDDRFLTDLRSGLEGRAQDRFRWRIELTEEWPFFLPPVEIRAALLELFEDYPYPAVESTRGLGDVRSHFDSLSRQYGFVVDPPDHVLSQVSDHLVASGQHQAALDVLHLLVQVHPYSLDGPWRLANLHRVMGDTAMAIRYYSECVERDPNMTPARQWLERLGGGG
jgi:predicted alpha/beta superfamily hydrolase